MSDLPLVTSDAGSEWHAARFNIATQKGRHEVTGRARGAFAWFDLRPAGLKAPFATMPICVTHLLTGGRVAYLRDIARAEALVDALMPYRDQCSDLDLGVIRAILPELRAIAERHGWVLV